MSKVLIAYASRTGETRKIGDLIAEGIRLAGLEATVTNANDIKEAADLSGYDAYVLGSATYHGAMLPAMKKLLFLCEKANLDGNLFLPQMDPAKWPELKEELKRVFMTKTQDEWCKIMEGTDVCFAPVLSIFNAPDHPHNKARGTFVEIDGEIQPGPAPRFSRTVPKISHGPHYPGEDTVSVLSELGFIEDEITILKDKGIIGT